MLFIFCLCCRVYIFISGIEEYMEGHLFHLLTEYVTFVERVSFVKFLPPLVFLFRVSAILKCFKKPCLFILPQLLNQPGTESSHWIIPSEIANR